jgi:hypothetical protein
MDNDSMLNMSWVNGQPIESTTFRPGVNALEDQYHQESGFQRFLRQNNHNLLGDLDLGFGVYDQAPEGRYRPFLPQITVGEPLEERPVMLQRFSTVRSRDFRRYITPPTSPELPAVRPAGYQAHDIPKPLPDLMSDKTNYTDETWYGDAFYAGTMSFSRTALRPLEEAFIHNHLGLLTDVLLLVYKNKFPLVPWTDAQIKNCIEQARWAAKRILWTAEEINPLRNAALRGECEYKAWLALRVKWLYYTKSRRNVDRRYNEILQELALGIVWLERYDEDEQLLADALAQWPEHQG